MENIENDFKSFKSESLLIDYITLNLRNGKTQIEEIANIFNCYIYDNNQKRLNTH